LLLCLSKILRRYDAASLKTNQQCVSISRYSTGWIR